jgi:K+-sensing histidine kinase KdpD
MASISSFRSRLRADPVARPNLRLVDRTPDQSPKTAVMACLSARSGNSELLRKADAAAREHSGELYAVFVDLPSTRFRKDQVRALFDDAILANSLGAKIIWLESSDEAGELLQLARQFHVGRILISRSQPAPLFHPFKRTVYSIYCARPAMSASTSSASSAQTTRAPSAQLSPKLDYSLIKSRCRHPVAIFRAIARPIMHEMSEP